MYVVYFTHHSKNCLENLERREDLRSKELNCEAITIDVPRISSHTYHGERKCLMLLLVLQEVYYTRSQRGTGRSEDNGSRYVRALAVLWDINNRAQRGARIRQSNFCMFHTVPPHGA